MRRVVKVGRFAGIAAPPWSVWSAGSPTADATESGGTVGRSLQMPTSPYQLLDSEHGAA